MAKPAQNDLVDVAAWYVERHPQGERRFFDAFAEVHGLLAGHPHLGRQRDDLRAGVRCWPVHPYIVFYIADDDARVVAIIRVIHGRMDIDEETFER